MAHTRKKRRTHSVYLRQRMIQRRKNQLEVEKFLLRGITNQTQIGAAIGVTQSAVSGYIKRIEEEWVKNDPKRVQANRLRRVRQLEQVMQDARNSFDLSKGPGGSSPGDPQYLRIIRDCIRDISKLEVLVPRQPPHWMQGNGNGAKVSHTQVHANAGEQDAENMFLNAPPELVIEAKIALDRLERNCKGNEPSDG